MDYFPWISLISCIAGIVLAFFLIRQYEIRHQGKSFGCFGNAFVYIVVASLASLSFPFVILSLHAAIVFAVNHHYFLLPVLLIVFIACCCMITILWGGLLYIQNKNTAPAINAFYFVSFKILVPIMMISFLAALCYVLFQQFFLENGPEKMPIMWACLLILFIFFLSIGTYTYIKSIIFTPDDIDNNKKQ